MCTGCDRAREALTRAEWETIVLAKALNTTTLAPLREALLEIRAAVTHG